MDLASIALLATVSTPYGVPVDGFPSPSERVLLLWTNAARVAPEEFEDEYEAGYEPCTLDDFEPDERVAKAPLYLDLDLTEVARVHSEDMAENGCFQHESCDGTDTWTRIGQYYSESTYLGENIAMGTTDPRYAVMGMWMCSSGHRANIMTGDYNEMGPGISGQYLTQDFAAGTLAEGDPPVRVAVEDGGTWYADWGDDDAPAELQLVVEGVPTDLSLAWGEPEQGIYEVEPGLSSSGCQAWYTWWKTAAGESGTFPAAGSFLYGSDCGNEDWTEEQALRGGLFYEVPEDDLHGAMLADLDLVGCSSAPGGAAAALAGIGLALATLRRRR